MPAPRALARSRPGIFPVNPMKITNRHERLLMAPPERLAPLIDDFDRIWPTQLGPAPQLVGDRLYEAGRMLWREFDRPGALRAFRVVKPDELRVEHWFEAESAAGATILRHTVEGYAIGRYEAIWRERIEPSHDVELEALLDNVQAAVSRDALLRRFGVARGAAGAGGPRSRTGRTGDGGRSGPPASRARRTGRVGRSRPGCSRSRSSGWPR